MHARLDQLLSLRDGAPVAAEIRDHVQHCASCLAESARLVQMRVRLQSLPSLEPPADFWSQIEARGARPVRGRHTVGIAAALVGVVAGAIAFVGLRDVDTESDSIPGPQTSSPIVANGDVEQLMARSRELEELLAYLPDRPQVERVSTAATVDSLEQRIQWLDWRLAYDADAGLNAQQAQRLWSERVALMDSLVKVRYAQSAPMVF